MNALLPVHACESPTGACDPCACAQWVEVTVLDSWGFSWWTAYFEDESRPPVEVYRRFFWGRMRQYLPEEVPRRVVRVFLKVMDQVVE